MPRMDAPRTAMVAWLLTAAPAQTPGASNDAGNPGETRDYVVSSVEFDDRKHALSFVVAPRRVAAPDEKRRWDLQYGATLSYAIMPRLVVSAGYLRTRDEGQVENTFGTAVNDVLRF